MEPLALSNSFSEVVFSVAEGFKILNELKVLAGTCLDHMIQPSPSRVNTHFLFSGKTGRGWPD
jgi:hypothetical protein